MKANTYASEKYSLTRGNSAWGFMIFKKAECTDIFLLRSVEILPNFFSAYAGVWIEIRINWPLTSDQSKGKVYFSNRDNGRSQNDHEIHHGKAESTVEMFS